MAEHNPDTQSDIASDTREDLDEPPMFRVMLLNDDYTTMDFVIEVVRVVFKKSLEDATQIMLNVHRQGVGVCGMYPFEVAETKVDMVHALANEHGFPLKCVMEKE